MSKTIPKHCDVLIIGGGPAGSSAATLLAKAGIDSVLLEKTRFPRPQVGESLIPHFWKYTDQLGVSQILENEGFVTKAGGITVWEGDIHRISFAEFGFKRPALHVERDIFDDILLRHAQTSGAAVFENVSAKTIKFEKTQVVVEYLDKRDTESSHKSTIKCRYIIDASGYNTVIAQQNHARHHVNAQRQFLSLWGYFNDSRYFGADAKSYSVDQVKTVKPVTFVSSFKEGWVWHIPLRESTSVGLVLNTDKVKGLDYKQREAFFLGVCSQVPYLNQLIDNRNYMQRSLCARPDYSYYVAPVCDDQYYCIGDAGGFVDPIFSHGVLNAFYTSALAVAAVKESLNHPAGRKRYAQICANRIRQFYSFSRALSLGDFHINGTEFELIGSFMRSVPRTELELMLAASHITHRDSNFRKLMDAAKLTGKHLEITDKARLITELVV